MKRTKIQKGITLIALIITIIILLILAVVTIGSIKNSDIITYAQNAATDFNAEKDKELSVIEGYESLIESKLPIKEIKIAEAQQDSMLTKTVNSITYDLYGNKIVIPAGFKILVDATTGYTSDNIDVTKGIVIQDGEGNEFVWIPVGKNITNENKTADIKLSRYTFDQETGEKTDAGEKIIDNYFQELAISNYGNATAKNLSGFISSANNNKGYYIARYEAGVTGYDASNIITTNSNKETNWTGYVSKIGKKLKLVSKSEQQIWNHVTQNKASELCRNMYADNKNYTSDLINSYAWDTAIVFIQTFGNESDASKYSILNKSTSFANTGMNNDKYCNIHDLSGNAKEWSTEAFANSSFPSVFRGGYYSTIGSNQVSLAHSRSIVSASVSGIYYSFRSLLYIE